MKAGVFLVLLSFTVLTAVAADTPPRRTVDEDRVILLKVARDYSPEGATMAQVDRVPGRDVAYVRYSVREGAQYVIVSVVTLKKTPSGWKVESCAR